VHVFTAVLRVEVIERARYVIMVFADDRFPFDSSRGFFPPS